MNEVLVPILTKKLREEWELERHKREASEGG